MRVNRPITKPKVLTKPVEQSQPAGNAGKPRHNDHPHRHAEPKQVRRITRRHDHNRSKIRAVRKQAEPGKRASATQTGTAQPEQQATLPPAAMIPTPPRRCHKHRPRILRQIGPRKPERMKHNTRHLAHRSTNPQQHAPTRAPPSSRTSMRRPSQVVKRSHADLGGVSWVKKSRQTRRTGPK